MPRPKNPVPTYSRHPIHGNARTWVNGRWVALGTYDSPESRAEFARICTEQVANAAATASAPPVPPSARTTVNELLAAFFKHASTYHVRPDGTQTREVDEFRQMIRVVRAKAGGIVATEFGPVALKAVRQAMIDKGWCRSRVNKQVGRVRRAFKWAVSEQLVGADVWAALQLVDGLRKNRSAARETRPIEPAPEADVAATLPELVPTVRAMVEVQRRGGLRPVEVRHLVPADVDRSGEIWVYRPDEHKMSHLGITKAIPLAPAARAALEPWLAGRKPDEYVFSPSRAREEMYAERRARRVSKVTPSQVCRRKPAVDLRKKWAARFTDFGYAHWVQRACKRAGVKPWTPGQLRHSFGTEVRARFGLEVAQVMMGHANAKTTEIYAEVAMRKATEAARAMG